MMYEKLCSKENLLQAFINARKGKTNKYYVRKFENKLEENLDRLREELLNETYKPNPLKLFIIKDPKTRRISKSRFRDRIIHHAIINIIGNIFTKRFIFDSFANQKGKGALKAVQRFNKFKRKVSKNHTINCYVLKADIKHYFNKIDHKVLLKLISKQVQDSRIIALITKVLRNGKGANEEKGMPLGNFTSQFFANVYLNELDRFVKHQLKAKYYLRYVDDFVIIHASKKQLITWKHKIDYFLIEKLEIELHPDKTKILKFNNGITFLGFRIFPKYMLIRKSNMNNFNRKLIIIKTLYSEEIINRDKVVEFLEGWISYIKHADTFKYRKILIKTFNKEFPTNNKKRLLSSNKKTANFLKKLDYSKLEFSVQQTYYLLVKKKLSPEEIAIKREIKESTVWKHISNLIEFGQLSVWKTFSKRKIVQILGKINSGKDKLKEIRERLKPNEISFDKINCVLAHVKFKEKICKV